MRIFLIFFYIFCQNFFMVKILSDLTDFLLTSPQWAPVCWKTIFFLKDIFTSLSHRTPPKTFTYFAKYRLKKSSKYCMINIFEIFHFAILGQIVSSLIDLFSQNFCFLIFFPVVQNNLRVAALNSCLGTREKNPCSCLLSSLSVVCL